MRAGFDIRKYSAAEIALLVIFALGLLLASFVVGYRAKIRLSKPIGLKLAGVSVSLPSGGGWRSMEEWHYSRREDVFSLTGRLGAGSRTGAIVQWRYMAAAERLKPEEQLSKQGQPGEVEIVDAGRIGGDVVMEWAQARVRGGPEDIFLGTAWLGNGHVVELEVVTSADAELAERIFRAMAPSLKFIPRDSV